MFQVFHSLFSFVGLSTPNYSIVIVSSWDQNINSILVSLAEKRNCVVFHTRCLVA